MTRRTRVVALSVWPLIAACASTSPAPAFRDVASRVQAQSGHRVRWDQNTAEDAEANKAIDKLLAGDLTVDGAVEVALLGSPRLRSTLEELSIAQADLVQAGLLKNPVFSIGSTAWESEHIQPNLFASVEMDFVDLVTLPLRKRVAATELEETKLEVGDEILKLASEVRAAFFQAQAAEQLAAMKRLVNDAAQVSAELAKKQAEAGTMNELNMSHEVALASQTKLALTRSEANAAVERERLIKLMGIWGTRTAFRLSPRLPELPADEVPLDKLESKAIEKRLDIGAARREVQVMESALSLAKTTRWTGMVNVQVEAGRLRHSKRLSFGPSVALEIPLFDQRQAAIARLEAFKRQAENNLLALSIEARSDVRAARERLVAARAIVTEYGKVFVPLRESIVKLTQEQYDAMLIGVYQLLQAKQAEFAGYQEYIEALRDYWIARSDLERAVGVKLGATHASPSPALSTQAPAASHPH